MAATINNKSVLLNGTFIVKVGETVFVDGAFPVTIAVLDQEPQPGHTMKAGHIDDGSFAVRIGGFEEEQESLHEVGVTWSGKDAHSRITAKRLAQTPGGVYYKLDVTVTAI